MPSGLLNNYPHSEVYGEIMNINTHTNYLSEYGAHDNQNWIP